MSKSKLKRIPNVIYVKGVRKTCRIYDNGGTSFDRYTVAFRGYCVKGRGMSYPYLASSEHPFHPQGFGQHGESCTFVDGKHLGKRIRFDECPKDVQKFIQQNLAPNS